MKNKQRQMHLAIKSLSEDGSFDGCLSPYNNVDDGGDVVEPGAYTKTLQESGNKVPMLWQHDAKCPIGDLTLSDQPDGLYCKGQFLLDIPEAKKAYLLLKAKVIKGLSIGYDPIKAQVVNGVRHLKEIRLYEGSVVTFPMNALAAVSAVKMAHKSADFDTELAAVQLSAAHYQYVNALELALDGIRWSTLSPDDAIAAFDVVLDQFAEVYRDYLSAYLMPDAKDHSPAEVKEGRRFSAASKQSIQQAHKCVKDATDILFALLDDGADAEDDITPEPEAATDQKSKPDDTHLAAESLKAMRALLAHA